MEQLTTIDQNQDIPEGQVELLRNWPAEELLAANLEGLVGRDEELARAIGAVEIPDEVEPAVARDGSVSFRLRQPDGRRRWLGSSSVPVIAAGANVKRIKPGKANLVMQGMGSGAEAQMLLEMMPPYQALLVVESELLYLNLVLRLRDLRENLANGRLVLLVGDEPEQLLEEFFRDNSGYNLIDQTIAWPWKPQRTNQVFAQRISGSMQRCGNLITQKVNVLVGEMEKYDGQEGTQQPAPEVKLGDKQLRVMNCTSAFTLMDVYTSRDCLAGLGQLGAAVEHEVLDRADMISPVAQLERLARHKPQLIMLVDMLRWDLNVPLPGSAVCVSILRRPGAGLFEAESTSRMGENDFVCPCLEEQARQLKEAGYPPERIIHLPLAANTELFQPGLLSPEDEQRFGSDVVMIADRCGTDPENYEIKLPTHQQLWRQVAEDIRNAPAKYHYEVAGNFLRRAQRCGIELKEQDLRQYFTELVQNYLGETVLRDCYAETLAEEDVDLRIWSWSRVPGAAMSDAAVDWAESGVAQLAFGTISSGPDLNKLFNAAKIVVHISSTGYPDQYLFDGIAAGAFFLVKSHPRNRKADGIGEYFALGKEIITFDTPQELLRKVRYYLEHEQERNAIANKTRQKLLAQHSYQKRMRDMLKRIGQM